MSDENNNTNCLEGHACPTCGQFQSFQVGATSTFTVLDDGTDGHSDVEYDHDSPAYCTACNWSGNWGDTVVALDDNHDSILAHALRKHPAEAREIAELILMELLYVPDVGRLMTSDEEFPSGVDLIEEFTYKLPHRAPKVFATIKALQAESEKLRDEED